MKHCASCEQTKSESEFATNKGRYDGLQAYCRPCKKKLDKSYYKKDPAKQAARNKLTALRNKQRAWQYLKEHPCVDCGIDNPVILTFDHVKGEKRESIARMINASLSWKTILSEIDKCVVRCFNCHMLKTARERGWHKLNPLALSLDDIEKVLGKESVEKYNVKEY